MAPPRQITDLSDAISTRAFWYAGESCDLLSIERSDTLLVTFDNLATIDQRPDTRPWPAWLGTRAEAMGFSILGVQSHNKDWYRTPEAPALIKTLQEIGYFERFRQIVFVGASMGGFAALCFAGLVPGARVLAFSPQSTLNRQIAPFEMRYRYPFRRFDWDSPGFLDASEHLSSIASGHIFFDPWVEEDRLHAARMQHPNIKQVKIPHSGHLLIRVVIKAGAFDPLLEAYATQGVFPEDFWPKMRNRRANRVWAKNFLNAAEVRGDGPLLRRACQALHQSQNYRFARLALNRLESA